VGVVSLGLASVPAALTSVRLGLESLSLRDQVPRHGRAGLLGSAWVDLIGTTGARDPGVWGGAPLRSDLPAAR